MFYQTVVPTGLKNILLTVNYCMIKPDRGRSLVEENFVGTECHRHDSFKAG